MVAKTGERSGDAMGRAIPVRSPLPHISVLHQAVGNQAVGRLILQSKVKSRESVVRNQQPGVNSLGSTVRSSESEVMQPKFSINKTNDIHEQEADRKAEQARAQAVHLSGPKSNTAMPAIQRKIEANTIVMKNNSLDNYFRSKGITAYSKSGGVYSRGWTSTTGLEKQILSDMLASDRKFTVAGILPVTAGKNLDRHVKARAGVADYTKKGTYAWGVESSARMNPRYWRSVGGSSVAQFGVTTVEAARDVFTNPSRFPYAMACHAAAGVTMVAGSGSDQYREPHGVKEHDWVPGDWGYLVNPGYVKGKSKPGHEGQNMIYLGDGKYWGHPAGVKTISGWKSYIWLWDKAEAKLKDWRRHPAVGLD